MIPLDFVTSTETIRLVRDGKRGGEGEGGGLGGRGSSFLPFPACFYKRHKKSPVPVSRFGLAVRR